MILFPLAKYSELELIDYMVILFLIWGFRDTILHSCWTNLHSHELGTRLLFPHSYQHLLPFVFLITIILTSVEGHLFVILLCISMMVNNGGHLLIYLFTIWKASFKKCLFKNCAHFLIWLLSCDRFEFLIYALSKMD
jgi:hypothetical protein